MGQPLSKQLYVWKTLLESKTHFAWMSFKLCENSNCRINLLLNVRDFKLDHFNIFCTFFPFLILGNPGATTGTVRCFRASDIFGRKFTSRPEEPQGTCSYRRITLLPSYMKRFSSTKRKKDSTKPRKSQAVKCGLESNALISIFSAVLLKVYHKLL